MCVYLIIMSNNDASNSPLTSAALSMLMVEALFSDIPLMCVKNLNLLNFIVSILIEERKIPCPLSCSFNLYFLIYSSHF